MLKTAHMIMGNLEAVSRIGSLAAKAPLSIAGSNALVLCYPGISILGRGRRNRGGVYPRAARRLAGIYRCMGCHREIGFAGGLTFQALGLFDCFGLGLGWSRSALSILVVRRRAR
jgi:hypothetical protein